MRAQNSRRTFTQLRVFLLRSFTHGHVLKHVTEKVAMQPTRNIPPWTG